VIAISWAYLLEPPKKLAEFRETSPGASVVGVPGLFHIREFIFQPPNEREKANAIGCHSQGIALRHSFFAEDEGRTFTILTPDHEDDKVPITIKGKLCTRRPLVSNRPQHDDSIQLVECVLRINEQKSPVFMASKLLPKLIDSMDPTFYAGLKARA
jgi:hypothetical protein